MKQLYELEFNENDLGPMWMNEDNLKLCLFSAGHTKPDLLKVKYVTPSNWKSKLGHFALGLIIAAGVAILFLIAYMLIFTGIVVTHDVMTVFGG